MYQQPLALPMELTQVARNAKYFWGCDESHSLFCCCCLSTGLQSDGKYYKNLTKTLTKCFQVIKQKCENILRFRPPLKKAPSLGDIGLVKDHRGDRLLLVCWFLKASAENTSSFSCVMNLCKDGDSTAFLVQQQCLATLMVNVSFILSSWDDPSCNLFPLPPILLLCSSGRALSLSSPGDLANSSPSCTSSAARPMHPDFAWTSSNFSKESAFRYNHFKFTLGERGPNGKNSCRQTGSFMQTAHGNRDPGSLSRVVNIRALC